MKRIYWRPRVISRMALLLISSLSIAGLLLVEHTRGPVEQPYYFEKLAASRLAADCMEEIKSHRVELGYEVDETIDPADTGMIGLAMTSATSKSGVLPAKQVSANPNFAAVVVEMLKKAGIQEGDTVAVGYSGSFPALNVCVAAALETLKLKPVCIASVAASQWGANLPEYLWVDMEQTLEDADLIQFHSVAASIGGVEDRGLGMAAETRTTLLAGIERNNLPLLEADSFEQSVKNRMDLYQKEAEGARIKVYINVGGGTTSVGRSLGKKQLRSGLNMTLPVKANNIDSVMTRFLNNRVPVIHLVRVRDLARRFGLPVESIQPVQPGEGQVFVRKEYNVWVTSGVLVGILLSLYALIRSDWGFRIFQSASTRSKDPGHPEPMI